MIETVSRIKAAETESEDIKKQAVLKSKQLSDDATAAGKKLVRSERDKASRAAADIVANASAKAQSHREQSRIEAEQACTGIAAKAGARIDQAAAFIVERIVGNQ